MKKILAFALLSLLMGACSKEGNDDGSSLLDMYDNDDGELENEDGAVVEEEEPYSIGPSEIPDDLVLPE